MPDYGKLTFREVAGTRAGKILWLVDCECGRSKVVQASNVLSGRTTSCGCEQRRLFRERMTRHGQSKSPTYRSWYAMIARCKKNLDYVGRVKVCRRWLRFKAFYADMGDRPPGHTLERRENEGDYTPENCRWATRADQNRNTRHNVMLTFSGRTMCAADWARELGMSPKALRQRLYRGWTLTEILTTPKGACRASHSGLLAPMVPPPLWR